MMKKTIYSRESKTLAKWLKANRKKAALTIRELAEELKVHHSIIGKIESGERRLDVIEYISYCKALKIKPENGIKEINK